MSKKMIVFSALAGLAIAAVMALAYFFSVDKTQANLKTSPSSPVQNGRAADKPITVLADPKVDASPSAAASEPRTITRPGDVKQPVAQGAQVPPQGDPYNRPAMPDVTNNGAGVARLPQPQPNQDIIASPSAQREPKPASSPSPMVPETAIAPPAPVAAPKSTPGVEAVIVSGQKSSKSVQADPKASSRGNSLTIQLPKRQ